MTALRRVTVDLTPLLPGGDNGGAKFVARALVHHMAALAPETEFTLLTTVTGHADCADLDAPNVHRTCLDLDAAPRGALAALRVATRLAINTLVPAPMRARIKDRLWLALKRQRRAAMTHMTTVLADVMFCPFTAPYYFDPRVPLVSLVHDIQYLEMPQFFSSAVAADRHRNFTDACRVATRLICVSEFVRQTVIAHGHVPPERVQTIHSTVLHAIDAGADARVRAQQVLASLGVDSARYLFYPANVWPHKNHARLIEALATYLRAHPESDLALVCTGAPGPAADAMVEQARARLPRGRIGFAGYVPEQAFSALLCASRALIFPSLYEGFGLPVLEAMALGKPVLCSNVTSLPEIAGDAAVLFDPYDPADMAGSIQRLEHEPGLEDTLVRRGRARAAAFGTPRDMAARYLTAFEDVIRSRG